MIDTKGTWWKHQIDGLGDILQELLVDEDPGQVKRALNEAIDSWKNHHQKELDKWTALQELIN